MNVDVFDSSWEANFAYYYKGVSGKYCRFTTDIQLEVGHIVVMKAIPYDTLLFQIKSIKKIDEMTVVEFERKPRNVARAIEIRDMEHLKQYDIKDDKNE